MLTSHQWDDIDILCDHVFRISTVTSLGRCKEEKAHYAVMKIKRGDAEERPRLAASGIACFYKRAVS
ncbi:hypothetical protein B1A75_09295 [Geobacillus sp. LEMMY01]|nr:hypothetical protein B1A75_09295 [Geobacillus sp. LEMMY01]